MPKRPIHPVIESLMECRRLESELKNHLPRKYWPALRNLISLWGQLGYYAAFDSAEERSRAKQSKRKGGRPIKWEFGLRVEMDRLSREGKNWPQIAALMQKKHGGEFKPDSCRHAVEDHRKKLIDKIKSARKTRREGL
jgi:hypothetical protein